MKYKIKFSSKYKEWDWIRQTSKRSGIWNNCQFFINEDVERCDFYFIYEDILKPEKTICSSENIFLITGEPEIVNKYSKDFFSQFEKVVTSLERRKSNFINHAQGQPWRAGVKRSFESKALSYSTTMDYDNLVNIKATPKSKLISLISSNKTITIKHTKRVQFIEKLKNYFGNDLDVFGIGFNEIEDKWDAIAPYKYSVVIENSSYSDYWTEKLADAYLGFSYPIYYGCKNIDKYFDKESMAVIDINDFQGSVKTIEKVISGNYYEKYFDKIVEARELVLNKYNVFALMSDFVNKHYVDGEKKLITIYPQKTFEKKPNIFKRVKNKILRIYKEKIYGIR